MTNDEIIKKLKECQNIIDECHYNFNSIGDIIQICNKLKALGFEWGDKLDIPYDFRISQKYWITNSATHYQPDKDAWYIEWDNGNVGCLQFVSSDYWWAVQDEWNEFINEMLSFNPLDYDPMNCHIIYDVENGKKVMSNYRDLCKRTQDAMNKKVKEYKIKKKQEELAKLLEEE